MSIKIQILIIVQRVLYTTVIMRFKFGYKYLWQVGSVTFEADRKCIACGELNYYVLNCQLLMDYRNIDITDSTEKVVWLIANRKVQAILRRYIAFAPSMYERYFGRICGNCVGVDRNRLRRTVFCSSY